MSEEKQEKELGWGFNIIATILAAFAIGPGYIYFKDNEAKVDSKVKQKNAEAAYKSYLAGKKMFCGTYFIVHKRHHSDTFLKKSNVFDKNSKDYTLNENNQKYDVREYTFNKDKDLFFYLPNCELYDKTIDYTAEANKKKDIIYVENSISNREM